MTNNNQYTAKTNRIFARIQVAVPGIIKYFIILLVLTLGLQQARGQFFITVGDSASNPVADARVFVVPLYEANPYRMAKSFYTDNTGKATSSIGGRCLIKVQADGFALYEDTLQLIAAKTVYITLHTPHIETETVVVTGTYEPTTVDKSVSKIKIIDAKRIQSQGAVTLKDVLSNELNVRLKQDNVLGSSLSLQGIGGQNIKILVDGVPMIGRMDGNIDLSQINLNNIERIEIIEGPMSVMYGTDALGGVINLITKKSGKHSVEGNVNTYYETVGNYNIDGRAAVKFPKGESIQVSGGRNFFDGYGEHGLGNRAQVWKPKEQYYADAIGSFNIKKTKHRVQSLFFNELLLTRGEPVVSPYSVYAFDNYFYTRRINNSLFSEFELKNKGRIQLINAYSWFRRNNLLKRKDLVSLETTNTQGATDNDTSIFGSWLFRGIYTSNRTKNFAYQLGYDVNLDMGKGRRISGGKQYMGDYALYATAEYHPSIRLVLRPGIRASYNTRYGSPITPSFNLKYDIRSNVSVRGSYARGFRAPSLKEMNLFFVDMNHNIQPNENLKAELSDNFNASLLFTHTIKKVGIRIEPAVFYNDIRNMISLAVVDPATQLYKYVNIDHFTNTGANINTEVKINNITVQAGASVIAYRNYLNVPGAKQYTSSNEYRGTINYLIARTKTQVSVFYKYNGRVPGYAVDENNQLVQTSVQGYSMADISLTQSFSPRFTLVVGSRNIFNVGNINYSAATGGAHSGGGSTMSIGMGRTFFTNLKFYLFKQGK